jgi:hypothetical protein
MFCYLFYGKNFVFEYFYYLLNIAPITTTVKMLNFTAVETRYKDIFLNNIFQELHREIPIAPIKMTFPKNRVKLDKLF